MVELYYNLKLKILSILWVRKWKLGFILSPIPPSVPLKFRQRICHLIWIYLSIGNFTLNLMICSFIYWYFLKRSVGWGAAVSLEDEEGTRFSGLWSPFHQWYEGQGYPENDRQNRDLYLTHGLKTHLSHIIGKGAFLCRLRSDRHSGTALGDQASWPWTGRTTTRGRIRTLDQCY